MNIESLFILSILQDSKENVVRILQCVGVFTKIVRDISFIESSSKCTRRASHLIDVKSEWKMRFGAVIKFTYHNPLSNFVWRTSEPVRKELTRGSIFNRFQGWKWNGI